MVQEKIIGNEFDSDSAQSEPSDDENKMKQSDTKMEEVSIPSGLQTPMVIDIDEVSSIFSSISLPFKEILKTAKVEEPKVKKKTVKKLTKQAKPSKKQVKKYTMEDIASLAINSNPKDKYHNFHEIGRGSYGKVYIATEKTTKRQVAIKHMNRMVEEDIDGIANEISLMKSCFHSSKRDFDEISLRFQRYCKLYR
jgi:hypothetical protein